MKYSFLFLGLLQLILQINSFAQNPINPYLNYHNQLSPGYAITIGNDNFQYSSYEANQTPGYNGEYMIDLNKLFWHIQNYPDPSFDFYELRKSYTMEVVSFPFTMPCAFNPGTGCAGSTGRNMSMPLDLYDNTTSTWGANLWRIRDQIPFAFHSGVSGTYYNPEALVSNGFRNTCYETPPTPPDIYYRSYLPHTVIKHTVYIHCGPNTNDPIITSFSWVYDNTRGRMRDYPFYPQNIDCTPCEATYDVTFRPYFLHKPQVHLWNEPDNDLLFTDGTDFGTINYYRYDEIDPNTCWVDHFGQPAFYIYDPQTYSYQSPFLPEYALLSSLLYKHRGETLAGYVEGSNQILLNQPGIKHNYEINQNIDLTILSPMEKVLYNPSEVNITATNLVFPSYYTFKTVRGRYPTENQVVTDNHAGKGGPFYDLRQVPVTTDLFSENSLDPSNEHVYASRYYLKTGSMLTIDQCVKIFDATFDIEAGATLIFDDYDQIIGKEDKSSFSGRYKLQGLGGAILRNNTDIQYVQNGDIFQTTPLNYIASSHIIAGKNVDPDTDQPDGIYEIKAGANVTFTAGDYIHLTDGFYVSGGDFHAYIDENMSVPVSCNANNSQNGGNRVQQQPTALKPRLSNNITVSPNPGIGQFDITVSDDGEMNSVSVFDLVGRRVYYSTNINEKSHQINLHPQIKGPMIVEVISNADEIKRVKIIVE